jgi:hypothetical protein
MKTQQVKVYKFISLTTFCFMPFVKIAMGRNTIEFRQIFIISRIMISIVIGLMGYCYDRVMKLIKKPSLTENLELGSK